MPSLVPTNPQPISTDLRSTAAPHGLGDGTAEVADIWRILWHRREWILAAAAILTAVTLLYCLLTPSIYSATVQILVDSSDRPAVGNDMNASTVASDGGLTQAATQVGVVQSAGVLLRAVAATNLTSDPEFGGVGLLRRVMAFVDGLLGNPPPQPTPSEAEERTLSALRRHLTVQRAEKVLVIDAAVTAQDPDKAARLANAIADAYLADQANARAEAALRASGALTARLAEQQKRVLAAAAAVERYKAEHNIVVATGQLVSEQQLADVNRELTAAQNSTAVLKAEIDQIERRRADGAPADATPEVMQSALVSKLREQEASLVEREAALESEVGPRFPALVAARSQLRDVRRLIDAELGRIAKAAQARYSRAVASERALAIKFESLKRQTQTIDQDSVRLRDLERDLEAVRSVYASYLVRAQGTREQANVDATNARIITRALPPLQRSWPHTGLLLAGALVAGLGLGAGSALLSESLAPTVLSIGQVETITGALVAGILPPEARPVRRRLPAWLRGKAKRTAASGPSDHEAASHIEAVIDLALRRMFGAEPPSQDRADARSVLVTSGAGDVAERDRIARLLAEVAASLGQRVLMVDADLAGNQQSPAAGLLDVLRGERAFESVLSFGPGGKVAFVAKGRRQSTSSGRVGQVFARRMLADARHRFDLVVVNGGAAVENPKVAPLAAAADEVLMVAKLNVTPAREVVAATEALSVMGCLVTAVLLVDPMARG